MKASILVLLLMSAATFATAADQKSADKKPTAKAQVISIPADAVEIAPNTYRSTDAQGKTWIYRKTPFGVSRAEDKPVSSADPSSLQESKDQMIKATHATEAGDSVHFVRDSPFGRTEWQKKKTDLNEVEQAVWTRDSAKPNTPETASKD